MKHIFRTTFFFLLLLPITLHAAVFSVSALKASFPLQEEFLVTANIDTQSDSINALEGSIVFPGSLLTLKEIRDGDSIITFWIEHPASIGETIRFSGVIPGGFTSPSGHVLTFVFQPKKEGAGQILVQDLHVLKNDEKASEAVVTVKPLSFLISGNADTTTIPAIVDANPPEKFTGEVSRNPDVYDGKAFLVFATEDKGVGMDYFEVKEGLWSSYVRAESPYLLQNQNLDKEIYIQAVDKNGNKRVSMVFPENYRPWYKNYSIILALLLFGVAFFFLPKKNLLKTFS